MIGLVSSLAVAPPGAGEDLPVQVPGELSEGNWAGTGIAWGSTTRDVDGVTFTFRGDYSAPVQLTIDGQTADGLYDFDGDWTLDGAAPNAELRGVYAGSGSGIVTGDRRKLVLDGTSSSGGTMVVKAAGDTRTIPADHPDSNDHFELEVTSSTCSEAYLDWESEWNLQLEDVGWQPTYSGTFVLVLDVEELRAAVDKWLENTRSGIDLGELDPLTRPPGLPGVVLAVEGVLRSFVAWSQNRPITPWQQTADLVYDSEIVLNRLRNASPCDRYLVGDDAVEQFITLVTDVVADGIEDLLIYTEQLFETLRGGFEDGTREPTGDFADSLMQLISIGLRTGVIGDGAVDADQAFRIEEQLRRFAERILTPFVDDENRYEIYNNAETRGVFAIAAMMGWKLTVSGVRWDADDMIAEYGDQTDFALPGVDE
jgi:hypothetical protein